MQDDIRPGQLRFYKGKGAAQFGILPPRFNSRGYVEKDGAVLLEAAPGIGTPRDPQWDWDQKITFAISIHDIAALADSDDKVNRVFHKHKDTPKTLQFTAGRGNTMMMNLAEGSGSFRRTITVPFKEGEYILLMRMLMSIAPRLINW